MSMIPLTLEQEEELNDAILAFKEQNPWKGNFGERIQKYKRLHIKFKRIFDKDITLKVNMDVFAKHWRQLPNERLMGHTDRTSYVQLNDKLSVITFLHEWAHVLGANEREAREWSTEVFKTHFPEKFARLQNVGEEGYPTMVLPPPEPAPVGVLGELEHTYPENEPPEPEERIRT